MSELGVISLDYTIDIYVNHESSNRFSVFQAASKEKIFLCRGAQLALPTRGNAVTADCKLVKYKNTPP
jgi:hypothetical protein